MKDSVEVDKPIDSSLPLHERIGDPFFRDAVELLDTGDEMGLRDYLMEHPELIRQRVFVNIGDYFGQPTLLEFVAENPIRRKTLPTNIVLVAKTILEAGAKSNRAAIDRTLGLVSSGMVTRKFGVQVGLIDPLCDYGADPDSAMGAALGHGEFEAINGLIRRGARVDLPTSAALGRTEVVKQLLANSSESDRHRALAYATQHGRLEVASLLLDAGEGPDLFNPVGCHSHSTPLHQAVASGNLDVVRLSVERGADLGIKDILYGGTPLEWAVHMGQQEVAAFLRNV